MATKKMYDLAFQYCETRIWEHLHEDQLFAVQLTGKEIGYCCVLGNLGQHIALGLYVGDAGYHSYRMLHDASKILILDEPTTEEDQIQLVTETQDTLQCSFEDKESLPPHIVKEIEKYARLLNKPLNKPDAYPAFVKYKPGKHPWSIQTKLDEQRITIALEAALELCRILKEKSPEEIGLQPLLFSDGKVPYLSKPDGRWVLSSIDLPPLKRMENPVPAFQNTSLASKIKNKKKKGAWDCSVQRLVTPVLPDKKGQAPYFPQILIAVNRQKFHIYPPVMSDGENAEKMLEDFANDVLLHECPDTIYVSNDKGYSLLQDLCSKTGIHLLKTGKTSMADRILNNMITDVKNDQHSSFEEMKTMHREDLEGLQMINDWELEDLPPELKKKLLRMAKEGSLPKKLAERVERLFS